MSQPPGYTIRKLLRLLLVVGILCALLFWVLYLMYRIQPRPDWWNILGGDPRDCALYRAT